MDEGMVLAIKALRRGIELVEKRARQGESVSKEELVQEMEQSEDAHQAFVDAGDEGGEEDAGSAQNTD